MISGNAFSWRDLTWMKWISSPSISVTNCGRALSLASHVRQVVEHALGRSDRVGEERRDAPREAGHERVQVGVGQGPVDPAVPFGLFGVEVVRAEDRLHDPAPSQQPRQVLHAARARVAPAPTSICPITAFSRAAERMSHASASSLPAPRTRPRIFAIDTTGSSLSLRHNMPSDASSGPPALAASAVYSPTLVRSTCGTKYSGWALSSTTTLVSCSDPSAPNSPTRSRTSSGPIRFIGGASITTPSTPRSLEATRSVRYT